LNLGYYRGTSGPKETVTMADDRLDDTGSQPDLGRAKRAPPTIDLEANEVQTSNASGESREPEAAEPDEAAETAAQGSNPAISPWVIAPVSGAVAAALVIGIGWMLGWPAIQAPSAAPQVTAAAFDELKTRLAGLESRVAKPPAPDPAIASRIEATEKALASLRGEVNNLRAQTDKLASAASEAKSSPADKSSPGETSTSPDLSALNERIAQIERASHAQSEELARESEKIAEVKPADDVPLRRTVTAALLDVLVRAGDSYQAALTAAKSLNNNPDMLKPLDEFAAKGVPSAAALTRELLTLIPKLSPPTPETSPSGGGIVDRLQAGAARLVRIERSDAVGNDRGAIVARVTAAALRNDLTEARRELSTLAPADRAPAQAWLDKAAARDAALAASRQFAADAMADLTKPAR
jgi:hypothetical protein